MLSPAADRGDNEGDADTLHEDEDDLEVGDDDVEKQDPSQVSQEITSNRPTQEEVLRIRTLLGRLQRQVFDQKESQDSDHVSVTLNQEEVELLAHLFGKGLLRAPSRASSLLRRTRVEMSTVEFSSVLAKIRGIDQFWAVNCGFKDLRYVVNVPEADLGIQTVGNQFLKLIMPLIRFVKRASNSGRVDLLVLKGISGAFASGKSTLVLGPPGCGVSTLFKALSGRLKTGRHHKLTGERFYSGFTPDEVILRKLVTYVPQTDVHISVLTVLETLQFAFDCMGHGKDFKIDESKSGEEGIRPEDIERAKELNEHFPEYIIDNFALQNCKDTIVGDDVLRGVSGGEKKRVTSSEMMMTRRPIKFFDQISTGLDSASTYDICRRLCGVSRNLEFTAVFALLQPTPETYELFDEIMILAAGHVVFHGKREDVLPYFESIGFRCPADRDLADFIQEVTTSLRVKYQVFADAPKDEVEMALAWEASEFSRAKREEIERFCDPKNKTDNHIRQERYAKGTPLYHLSWWAEFKLVLMRQVNLVKRDSAFIRARIGQSVVMGILIGTVFFDIDSDLSLANITGISQRYGVIFSTLMQSMLAGIAQVPVVLAQRPVYYKQSEAYFHRTSTFVISEMVSTFPIAILESFILSSLVFWLAAIVPFGSDSANGSSAPAVTVWLIFTCIMIAINISFAAFLRAIAAAAPSQPVAQVFAGVSIAINILFSGFIITYNNVPVWFIWIYWLVPLSWAIRSSMLAIFQSDAFTEEEQQIALRLFQFDELDNESFVWGGVLVLLGYLLFNMFASTFNYQLFRYTGGGGQTRVNPDAEEEEPEIVQIEREESTRRLNVSENVSTSKDGKDEAITVAKTMKLDFIPVDLAFRDLWYSVPLPGEKKKDAHGLDLLKGISGFCESGTMTALMGSSGAGKTTLMDVIAGRKTAGTIRGDILVNGRPQEKVSFSRILGYVEQNDIHSPHATVEEALIFSAFLRQPDDVPDEEKMDFVKGVMDTLELDPIKDFEIGYKDSGGLSVEQAKRLTIGVELAANPSLLFLDEPTSGLDSKASSVVMSGLEKIARTGRTVIATIHQPSKDIFLKFDRLVLLRRGGEMVFFGDLGKGAEHLLAYLQGIPGTRPMPNARYNPANYMLEVIALGGAVDYAHEYRESDFVVQNDKKLEALIEKNLENRKEIEFDSRFASSFQTQAKYLIKRWNLSYWRSISYNFTRIVINVLLSLLFGVSFLNGGEIESVQDVQSFVGVVFLSSVFLGVIAINTTIPVIESERTAFYRERAANMYAVPPMVLAITTAELPYILFSSFLFVIPLYFLVGMEQDAVAFFTYWGLYLLYITGITFYGQLLAVALPSEQIATVVSGASIGIMTLTAGFVIAVDDITTFWQFLPAINPIRYLLSGLLVSQLDCDGAPGSGSLGCSLIPIVGPNATMTTITAWDFLQESFGFSSGDLPRDFGALVGFILGFRLLTIWALTRINWQKR